MINITWNTPEKREVQVGEVSHGTFITHLSPLDAGNISACIGDADYGSVYRVFNSDIIPSGQNIEISIPDGDILLENISQGTFRTVKQTKRCTVLVRPTISCRKAIGDEIDNYLK